MSDLIRFADARRQSRATLHASWLEGGTLVFYDAPVPTQADDALTTQTALVVFDLPDPIGDVTDGVLTVAAIAATLIGESGTVAWARAYDATDAVIGDYDVGGIGSGAAIEVDNLSLVQGGLATITSFVVDEG
jgi:hypothetical protein